MKISLIIPAYNEELCIKKCLESAIKHSDGKFHEIIVVDNASTDKTREYALSVSGVKVVHESKKGLTRARQCGLEASTGDIIAYIDADTLLPPHWVSKVEKIFNEQPNTVCLSGPYRYHDGIKWKNNVMHLVWWLTAPFTYRIVGYMVLGGNFVARKDALLAMGGFDQSIDFYGEDTDIARRLSKHGKVVFDMSFFIHSSSRRFSEEGLIKTNITYALNFLWPILFKRPFTKKSTDIRKLSRTNK
ncbi:MAG: glycosyltransferase [Candidatus Pacebacteria bacterium]|nr:glycosyltransferase [Candidatus Paceibacterota bacterium]